MTHINWNTGMIALTVVFLVAVSIFETEASENLSATAGKFEQSAEVCGFDFFVALLAS